MFRFEHPEYFIAFAVLPLLLLMLLGMRYLRRRSQRAFALPGAMERLLSDRLPGVTRVKRIMLFCGFAFLCMALTNPQWGLRRETVQVRSADIFIALDISNSMLAEDIAPSRLERSRKFAQNLVQRFRGDRIGLILFAGNAYLQMPLTTDYASAELFISSAHPGLAGTQGTAIGEAIELATRAFEPDEPHNKALVIITDGENHEEGAIEAMQKAAGAGLIPFVVAVGTEEGAFIPIIIEGREDYKRDDTGNPVKTSVNVPFLQELAAAGNGNLYQVFNDKAVLDDMEEQIQKFEKHDVEQRSFKDYESYYQYFLLAAIALFGATWVLGNQKRKKDLS